MKKEKLIYSKIKGQVITTIQENPEKFYGCKTNEDVLMTLGTEVWGNVLCEVGYSSKYYITEVENMSKRFLKLLDKIVAMAVDEDLMKKICYPPKK